MLTSSNYWQEETKQCIQDSSRHAWHTAGTPQIVQAYPGDTANSFPYHYHKAEYRNDVKSCGFFGFLVHIHVTFKLYCDLLKVQ